MAKRGPKPKHSLASVLAAATEIVARDGLDALSMSAVARALKSSVSGLYRYVEGHEDLLVKLQQQAIEEYRSNLQQRLRAVTGHARQLLTEPNPSPPQTGPGANGAPTTLHIAHTRVTQTRIEQQAKGAGSIQQSLFEETLVRSRPSRSRPKRGEPLKRTASSEHALLELIAFCDYYRIHAESHPARHRLLARFVASPAPVLSDEATRAQDATLQNVLQLGVDRLQNAREVGGLSTGDDRLRMQLLWAGLHGLDQLRKRDRIQPEALRSRSLYRNMLATMLRGFGAPESALERAFLHYAACAAATKARQP